MSHKLSRNTCLLWSLNIHYPVHKSPPLVSVLNQMNSVHHTFTLYFFQKYYVNNVFFLSSHFPSDFTTKTLYTFPLPPMPATCLVYVTILDLIALIIFGESRSVNYKVSHYAIFSSLLSLSLCQIQVFCSVSCSQTLSLYPSIYVKVSHCTQRQIKSYFCINLF